MHSFRRPYVFLSVTAIFLTACAGNAAAAPVPSNSGGSSEEEPAKTEETAEEEVSQNTIDTSAPWYQAMKSFVMNQEYEDCPGLSFPGGSYQSKMALYDFNEDGVYELIMDNTDPSEAGSKCYVLAYDGNEVRYVGDAGTRSNQLYYLNSGEWPGLFLTDGNRGYYQTYYYTFDGTAVHEEIVLADEWTSENISSGIPEIHRETGNDDLYNTVAADTFNDKAVLVKRFSKAEIDSGGWDAFAQAYMSSAGESSDSFMMGEEVSEPEDLLTFVNQIDFSFGGFTRDFAPDKPFSDTGNLLETTLMLGLGFNEFDVKQEEITADPEGRFPAGLALYKVSVDDITPILKNMFNCSDDNIEKLIQAGDDPARSYYCKDGYLFFLRPGVGGVSHCESNSVRFDGQYYYYIFDFVGASPAGGSTYAYYDQGYAKLEQKTDGSKKYWSLLRYNRSPIKYPVWSVDNEIYEPVLGTLHVNPDNLNVRSAPSTSGDKLYKAAANTDYPVYEITSAEDYTWYRIGYNRWVADDNKNGWTDYSSFDFTPRHPG